MVEVNPISACASVLAVGTELTSGQIINRNAAWISEQVTNLGTTVVLHETVADDRAAIHAALNRCWSVSRMIFVCGGLGPTTDDFTREVIAEWLGLPLEFYEPSWIKIQDRLSRFGIPIAASNRQQCFYPLGSQVLRNTQGTADGFSCAVSRGGESGRIWALPGPPPEISAIWKDCDLVAAVRAALPSSIRPPKLFTWQCLGKSEAELGEITEAAVAGSGFATGYRFHRPYVEVKLWVPEDQVVSCRPVLDRLESVIGPWVVTRGDEDLASQFLDQLRRSDEIEVVDACSGGFLLERLGPFLRRSEYRELASRMTWACEWEAPISPSDWVARSLADADEEVLTLALAGVGPSGEWALGLREGARVYQVGLVAPWKGIELMDRSRSFAVEMAIRQWRDWLRLSLS